MLVEEYTHTSCITNKYCITKRHRLSNKVILVGRIGLWELCRQQSQILHVFSFLCASRIPWVRIVLEARGKKTGFQLYLQHLISPSSTQWVNNLKKNKAVIYLDSKVIENKQGFLCMYIYLKKNAFIRIFCCCWQGATKCLNKIQ